LMKTFRSRINGHSGSSPDARLSLVRRVWAWWKRGAAQEFPAPDLRLMVFAGGIFLVVAVSTLNGSSFFLNNDNPTQHVAGWHFAHGEWSYSGNKAIIMWLLALLTRVFGANPLNELYALTVLGVGASMALTDLAYVALGRRGWALLGTVVWLSLASTLYYFRMQMGFPLAWFVMGLAFYGRRRFVPAGACLLLAVLSHTSFIVPVVIWLGVSMVMGLGPQRLIEFVWLGGPMAGGYLAYEYVALRFTTELWHTALNFMREINKLDSVYEIPDQPLSYLWFLFKAGNGVAAAWVVTAALVAYPLLRGSDRRLRDGLYGCGAAIVGFFFVRGSLMDRMVVLRVLAGATPALAVVVAGVWAEVVRRLRRRGVVAARLAGVLLCITIPWHMTRVLLGMIPCSTTGYPAIEEVFGEAAEQGTTVVFFGRPWIGLYYQLTSGARTVIDQPLFGFEKSSPLRLEDVAAGEQVIVVWIFDWPPEQRLAEIEREYGLSLWPGGDVRRIPQPSARCALNVAEAPMPLMEDLRATHLLRDGLRLPEGESELLVWRVTP
jgi:hypothetical protein